MTLIFMRTRDAWRRKTKEIGSFNRLLPPARPRQIRETVLDKPADCFSGDDPNQIARQFTRDAWRKRSKESSFNRQIVYPDWKPA
jgi:hypothetical protein